LFECMYAKRIFGFGWERSRGENHKKKVGTNIGTGSSTLDVNVGTYNDGEAATDTSLNEEPLESRNLVTDPIMIQLWLGLEPLLHRILQVVGLF
nr:hypothetical protein [Tanacetum cinerariifolium]